MIGTTLGAMYGLSLGTYDGKVLRSLEVSTEGISEVKFEGLFLGA